MEEDAVLEGPALGNTKELRKTLFTLKTAVLDSSRVEDILSIPHSNKDNP